ncbi:hypothetical protein HU200_057136 [Digitaria exilis]|uniref:Uncharacterized protein n=1 Tax=Digitaria exilis TaxID=1010633 RepID=A0A835E555_9POAL|nr:hypothetical protein HU200_057136 [Digitaria exilis]
MPPAPHLASSRTNPCRRCRPSKRRLTYDGTTKVAAAFTSLQCHWDRDGHDPPLAQTLNGSACVHGSALSGSRDQLRAARLMAWHGSTHFISAARLDSSQRLGSQCAAHGGSAQWVARDSFMGLRPSNQRPGCQIGPTRRQHPRPPRSQPSIETLIDRTVRRKSRGYIRPKISADARVYPFLLPFISSLSAAAGGVDAERRRCAQLMRIPRSTPATVSTVDMVLPLLFSSLEISACCSFPHSAERHWRQIARIPVGWFLFGAHGASRPRARSYSNAHSAGDKVAEAFTSLQCRRDRDGLLGIGGTQSSSTFMEAVPRYPTHCCSSWPRARAYEATPLCHRLGPTLCRTMTTRHNIPLACCRLGLAGPHPCPRSRAASHRHGDSPPSRAPIGSDDTVVSASRRRARDTTRTVTPAGPTPTNIHGLPQDLIELVLPRAPSFISLLWRHVITGGGSAFRRLHPLQVLDFLGYHYYSSNGALKLSDGGCGSLLVFLTKYSGVLEHRELTPPSPPLKPKCPYYSYTRDTIGAFLLTATGEDDDTGSMDHVGHQRKALARLLRAPGSWDVPGALYADPAMTAPMPSGVFSTFTLPADDVRRLDYHRGNLWLVGGGSGTVILASIIDDNLEVLRWSSRDAGDECMVERKMIKQDCSWRFLDTAETVNPGHEYMWMSSVNVETMELMHLQKRNWHAHRVFPYQLACPTIKVCV